MKSDQFFSRISVEDACFGSYPSLLKSPPKMHTSLPKSPPKTHTSLRYSLLKSICICVTRQHQPTLQGNSDFLWFVYLLILPTHKKPFIERAFKTLSLFKLRLVVYISCDFCCCAHRCCWSGIRKTIHVFLRMRRFLFDNNARNQFIFASVLRCCFLVRRGLVSSIFS